jgi:ribonuclease BN (tRNA processing enzyme)
VTLGTAGGPVTRLERSQPSNALVVGKSVYVFDAGDGLLRQLAAARLAESDVRAVFLSHHHLDHVAGLQPLILSRWLLYSALKPLQILGPRGTQELVNGLIAASAPIERAPVTVEGPQVPSVASSVDVLDLPTRPTPGLVYEDELIKVTAVEVDHFHLRGDIPIERRPQALAYRVEAAGRTFVFTGDTGPSRGLAGLSEGADVLISEVVNLTAIESSLRKNRTMPPRQLEGLIAHMAQDHLTAAAIGEMAAQAKVGRVVLTHLVPGLDGERDLSGYTRGIAARYHGPVTVATDLARF